MIRFFLIDDHYPIIEALTYQFDAETNNEITIVGSATNMDDAIDRMRSLSFDLVVFDLYLQEHRSPVDNFNRIQSAFPGIPVVIFTGDLSLYWKLRMFRLGVFAFVEKVERNEALIEGIKYAAAHQQYYPENIRHFFIPGYKNCAEPTISLNDLEISRLLSNGRLIKQIAVETGRSTPAIEKSLRRMRRILKVQTNPELIRKMIRLYMIPATPM
ncbi:MAG: response regulator transcription factor [Bacteroidales bacterium]|nr:response regulator transcription factor [Bacteroidales bacterium]